MEVKRQGKDFVTTVANPIYDTVFKYLMVDEELLRPRQYLGFRYISANICDEGFSIPMVTIYLLGHKVGDIEEPVV